MESAGSHAYVSKNFMDAYLKKKQKRQLKKEQVAIDEEIQIANEEKKKERESSLEKVKEEVMMPELSSSLSAVKKEFIEDAAEIQEKMAMPQQQQIFKPLVRRRSMSRSNSSGEEEEIGRVRSCESLFEGELRG